MDPVTQQQPESTTAPTERSQPELSERSQPERTERLPLETLFSERYARLEQLEDAIRHAPASTEARQRLDLVRRAKFSTWLDLEALGAGGRRAA